MDDSLVTQCIGCHGREIQNGQIRYPLLQHYDFQPFQSAGQVAVCRDCGLIMNVLSPGQLRTIQSFYAGADYARSSQTSQAFVVKGHDRPVTRSYLQADLLAGQMAGKVNRVLDLGCFDGALLRELAGRLGPQAQWHGYDVNPHLRHRFPAGKSYHYWHQSLEEIPGPFDLVCMSHSLIYFNDLAGLGRWIRSRLAPQGQVFIQIPDIMANPCFLLMGDQCSHFCRSTLAGYLRQLGLAARFFDPGWAPRDIVCMARCGQAPALTPEIPDVAAIIHQLDLKARALRQMAVDGRLFVLGTTAVAAFADGVLNTRLTGFADENPSRAGQLFRDKSVIHPADLAEGDTLIVPYGSSAQTIVERFKQNYAGRFVAV